MARTEARIKCDIWDDEDFRSLTLEAQWLYHALLEQKDLTLCGVITWTPKRFAKLARNATAKTTRQALDLLRERRYVLLDEDTDELWVRTLIKNDRVLDNHNSLVGMSNSFGAIHSHLIRKGVVEGVGKGVLDGLPQGVLNRVAKPFRDALALTYAGAPPRSPVPPATSLPSPASPSSEHSSSSRLNSVAPAPDDDDEDPRRGDQGSPIDRTLNLIARRRYAFAEAKEPILNPGGYWRTVRRSVDIELGDDVEKLLCDGMAPEEIVDKLCPTASHGPNPYAAQQPGEWVEEADDEGRLIGARWVAAS